MANIAATPIGAREYSAALANNTDKITLSVRPYATLGISLSGTWVGTMKIQGAVGSNFVDLATYTLAMGTTPNSFTTNIDWLTKVQGVETVQVFFSAYTSGTVNIKLVGADEGIF